MQNVGVLHHLVGVRRNVSAHLPRLDIDRDRRGESFFGTDKKGVCANCGDRRMEIEIDLRLLILE